MLRYVVVVMLLLLSGAPALPAPVAGEFAPSYFDSDGDGVDDRLAPLLAQGAAVDIFLVFNMAPGAEQRRMLASLELEPSYESHYLPVWQLDGVPTHKVGWLTALPGLQLVEWQAIYYPLLSTSVPAVKARDSSTYDDVAWDRGLQGAGVNIAILDTGVDNEHETFEGRFIAGVDCVGGCNDYTTEEDSGGDPDDRNGHGTHTASTALGTGGETDDDGDGEPDYMGVAPEARLVDVKVMTDLGAGGNVLQGIEWCADHADEDWGSGTAGIQVMSMSVGTSGGSDGSDAVSQAANAAVAAGIVAVAAMGNDGDNVVPAPAAGDWVIAVGATDDQDTVDRDGDPVADYSNYGPRDSDGDDDRWDELKPDVVAPGSGIRAAAGASAPFTIATDGYTDMSGTSMSCPHVAGLAALMLQDDPGLEPGAGQNEVMWRMRNFSEQWGPASEPDNSSKYNYVAGWGYADAWAFVNVAQADAQVVEDAYAVLIDAFGQQGARCNHADVRAAEGFQRQHVGARDPRVQDVADDGDREILEVATVAADSQHVEHRLGRVGVVAVAGIDHSHVRADPFGDKVRGAGIAVAHDEHVGGHCLQVLQGVVQGFALAGRGGRDVQVEHVGRQPLGRQLKGGASTRGVFEEDVADRLAAQQRNLLDGALAHFKEGVGGVEQFGQQFARQPFNGQEVAQLALLVELQVVRRQAHGDLFPRASASQR